MANHKKKTKRHRVGIGDMVRFYTPQIHAYGMIGEVNHVISNKRVVVKCLAPGDTDYEGSWLVLETSKPSGDLPNGTPRQHYASYITKVIVRAKPKPPKEPKTILPAKVIETQAELLEHLHSESNEKVLLQLATEEHSA